MPSSPVTGSNNIELVKEIKTTYIVKKFKDAYGVDVSPYFTDLEGNVPIFRCLDTGYEFYYPFDLVGKPQLYEDMISSNRSYYRHCTWEIETLRPEITRLETLLEVGCGEGNFLKSANELGVNSVGLEFSPALANIGLRNGLTVLSEPLQKHVTYNPSHYDGLFCFQVLEHIPDVKNFINTCIEAVKPGGIMVVFT